MRIGIVCYASVGGSGSVATSLAEALADRGHDVHVLSSELPFRLRPSARLRFHRVETPAYPLFREPQYFLSLATKIAQVARATALDIVHAHYAIPHAAAAYLARQVLARSGHGAPPKIVTTLHGTDITLVGSDPSYAETTAYCIDESDLVTAVSESLRADTYRALDVRSDIRVIPNFLDCERYRRAPHAPLSSNVPVVMHMSNFRPVKRALAVAEIYRRLRAKVRARLLLAGEGPDLAAAVAAVEAAGLGADLEVAGPQEDVVPLLSRARVFLLPSATESFGLAALEAMACDAAVVASAVGGLPEVIEHGRTGFLHPPDDLDGMAASAAALLTDESRHRAVTRAAREVVEQRYCTERIVPMYEEAYGAILG